MLSAMNKPLLSIVLLSLTFMVTAEEAPPPTPAAPTVINFDDLSPGEIPDSFLSTDQEAKFSIAGDNDGKFLELAGQPIVDGGILLGKSIKGPATITARIKATGKRRTQPRFGVGLHGVSGPRLRVVPATRQIEIVLANDKEESIATAPYQWTSGSWLEFSIRPGKDGGSTIEGRVWSSDQQRPEQPSITAATKEPPAQGKASLWGTPYSESPIAFDDVTIKAE
jgi:hypothetical protein